MNTPDDYSQAPAFNPYTRFALVALLAVLLMTYLQLLLFPTWDVVFAWLIAINVVTFVAFGYDKAVAPKGATRVPEAILLLEVLTGACVGALAARIVFRHKTRKLSFRLEFWAAELFSIALVALYAYRYFYGG